VKDLVTRPFKKFLAPETQIVKHGRWYTIAPIAIIALGLLVVLIWNFNLGLDFTGGQIVKVTGINNTTYNETREVVRGVLEDELGRSAANRAFFQRENSELGGISLTVRYPEPKDKEKVDAINRKIEQEIKTRLSSAEINFNGVEPANSISASASAERMMNVFIAVFASLIGILLYMLFRFKFTSGVAAVVGLFHDVLIMLALVAIFRIQINFVFVAAVITVVAYSLNNTLVLFDRVRDKEKDLSSNFTVERMVDNSIKETFWRTLITTITTLVPIVVLCIFGVTSLREFAIPIVFGLLAGTYSTICITSTLYVRFENAKLARARTKKKNA
jgi:preprotein translocase SecF subunit